MESISPVWSEYEVDQERVIALDQPQYIPIIILPVMFSDGTRALTVRFRLSEEERKRIADGEDLVLTQLGGGFFVPTNITVCKPNEAPTW
jgi:hypothetical protein